ncbi:hypothetical protein [Actinomadura terrae]|uniref:hypothetical protein n=1 Tax=Actinomadura terrae TaxID=604353 RepID=UPI001FA6AF5D|nr:hypothetical protein [Actinomadura terrae]
MLETMVPDREPFSTFRADVAPPVAWALTQMTTGVGVPRLPGEEFLDLWAPRLPGESPIDSLSRRAAAADILDELLHEYAGECAEEPIGLVDALVNLVATRTIDWVGVPS